MDSRLLVRCLDSLRFLLVPVGLAALLMVGACSSGPTTTAPSASSPSPTDAPAPVAQAPAPVAALPSVPEARGPLDLRLAYPRRGAARPDADSTFLFGTTGTGRATLTINGTRIPLAPNGAFLAYLPVADAYRMTASDGQRRVERVFRYGERLTPADAEPMTPQIATVIAGRDTLAAGSEIVAGRTTPTGDRAYFFPRGARVVVDASLPGVVRVRLTDSTTTWVDANSVRLDGPAASGGTAPAGRVTVQPAPTGHPRHVDVRIPAGFAPFDVTAETDAVGVTVFGRKGGPERVDGGAFVTGGRWTSSTTNRSRLFLALGEPLWGYKAFYDADGAIVLRLRRPPDTSADAPLDGLRVLVDAGHPPGGAVGPTGLTESEANLAIAQRVAERLRARGATVVMTRTGPAPLENAEWTPDELWARVDLAVRSDADVLVSIHNNAFPDGTNPFDGVGTETYYFHPFSQGLAQTMVDELVRTTGLRNKGARHRSLALVRPTWMPSVLTESLFMMFPQQEAALRDPAFLDRLADAHVRALERFARERRRRP